MTEDSDVAAFRASLAGQLGGARLVPASETPDWRTDRSAMVDLGLFTLLDPDEGAGLEGLPFAVAAVQELALSLHPAPGPSLLTAGIAGAQLREEIAGEAVVAFALLQAGSVIDTTSEANIRISGMTLPLAGIDGVTHVIVQGKERPEGAYLIEVDEATVQILIEQTLDPTRTFAVLELDKASATAITLPADDLCTTYQLLVTAETAALVASAVQRTVEFARDRETFGQPIGRYQAVQHRLVAHSIVAQQMADLLTDAVTAVIDNVDSRHLKVLIAEVFCAERAHEIVSDCIQLTGGIGFTWEYGLHFPLRRVTGNSYLIGGARRAQSDLAARHGW